MYIYDDILQGHEATLQNAQDRARGLDWATIETTEGDKTKFSDYQDTVNGIDIYYCFGADYYYFVDATKKSIIDTVIENKGGHYVHCVEVHEVHELEAIAESITQEFEETHSASEILDFLESLEVYSMDDANEDEINSFSFTDYITNELI